MFLACFSHLGNVETPRVTNTAAIPVLTSCGAHLLTQSSSPRLRSHKALQPALPPIPCAFSQAPSTKQVRRAIVDAGLQLALHLQPVKAFESVRTASDNTTS